MRAVGDDDPNPSLVMSDLWHHWQPVASIAGLPPYPQPIDVAEVAQKQLIKSNSKNSSKF
jgi:hypothetical protein